MIMEPHLLTNVENLEDFIKVSFGRDEISERCANEMLRITSEIKDKIFEDYKLF